MVNFSNVAVIRPSSKVVQVPGGSSSRTRGGSGMKDFFASMTTLQDDIENKQLLKDAGLPPNIVDNMDSATLTALGQQVGMNRLTEIEQKGKDVRRGSAEYNFIEAYEKLLKGVPPETELNQGKGILAALTEPGLGREREGELEDVEEQKESFARLRENLDIAREQGLPMPMGGPEDPQVNGEIALDKQQPSLRYPLAGLPRDLGMGPGMPSGFEGRDLPESRIGELAPVAKVTPGIKAQRGMEAFFNAYQLLTDEERGILNRSIFLGKVHTEAGKEDAATAVFKRRLADTKRWAKSIAVNPETGQMGIIFNDKRGELKGHFAKNADGSWTSPAKLVEYFQNVPVPKTFAKIEEVFLEHANQLEGLNDVRIAFDKARSSLSTGGRFKTFIRRIFDHAGGFREHDFFGKSAAWLANKFAPDFIEEQEREFRNTVDLFISAEREFLQWRKFITGVAGGEKEFAEIRKSFLDVGSQGEVEFDQALTNLLALKKKSYEIYGRLIELAKKNKWTPGHFQAVWRNEITETVRKRDKRFFAGAQLTLTKKPPKITKKAVQGAGPAKRLKMLKQSVKQGGK